MKVLNKILYIILFLVIVINNRCIKNQHENDTEEPADTTSENLTDSLPVLCLPYISESDVTYIQPFGVPLHFGENDIRPHAAVDFGCNDGVEFKASESGILGNIWLEYSHSYQFNIIVDVLLNLGHGIYFRNSSEYLKLLSTIGFQIKIEMAHKGLPLSDILYLCKKN